MEWHNWKFVCTTVVLLVADFVWRGGEGGASCRIHQGLAVGVNLQTILSSLTCSNGDPYEAIFGWGGGRLLKVILHSLVLS